MRICLSSPQISAFSAAKNARCAEATSDLPSLRNRPKKDWLARRTPIRKVRGYPATLALHCHEIRKRNKKVALKPRPCMRTAGHALLCPSR